MKKMNQIWEFQMKKEKKIKLHKIIYKLLNDILFIYLNYLKI